MGQRCFATVQFIGDVDIGRSGQVYVAEPASNMVTVLSTSGTPVRTIGRKGSGPGEFRGIGNIQLGAEDTLFVFDNILGRLSAFRPQDDSVIYTRGISAQGTGNRQPSTVYRAHEGRQLTATYMPPFIASDGDGNHSQRLLVVRLIGESGKIERDSLLVGVGTSNLFKRAGSQISVGTNVFGRQPLVRYSQSDQVYYVRSDSGVLMVVGLDGTSTRRCIFTTPGIAVTSEDLTREQALASRRRQDALADSMPKVWPVIGGLVVDDQSGAWIGITGRGGKTTRWVLCDSNGQFKGFVVLPLNSMLVAVRKNQLYVIEQDEDNVPSVHAYRLSRKE